MRYTFCIQSVLYRILPTLSSYGDFLTQKSLHCKVNLYVPHSVRSLHYTCSEFPTFCITASFLNSAYSMFCTVQMKLVEQLHYIVVSCLYLHTTCSEFSTLCFSSFTHSDFSTFYIHSSFCIVHIVRYSHTFCMQWLLYRIHTFCIHFLDIAISF